MDFWQKTRLFAEGAAKRSQELSMEAAKRSQELAKGAAKFSQEIVAETAKKSRELSMEASKRSQELTKGAAKFSQEFVAETAKKSKELAAEASKRADDIRVEAVKRAEKIRALAGEMPVSIPPLEQGTVEGRPETAEHSSAESERFGVTDQLREFVGGITISTFRDFPMEDTDEPQTTTTSNVRQDLSEWQEQHATLVLSVVKEISRYRYELCPRYMKERKFWRIYFILVDNYVVPYEKQYLESKLKLKQDDEKFEELEKNVLASKPGEGEERKVQSRTLTSDNELDDFLLGDGSSDEGPEDVDGPDGDLDDVLNEIDSLA